MKRNKERKRSAFHQVMMITGILVLAGLAAWGALIGHVYWQETHVPAPGDYDAIVVLGAQVLPDGTPNVQLEWRLLAALAAYEKRPALIVTCGAQGADEPRPEADVMRDWLIARGVPENQVLAENTSFNTLENIQNALALVEGRGVNEILVVTSDYHLPRALAIAGDAGAAASGLGSACKPEYWLKNHSREALAWVKYWGQKYWGLFR